MIEIGKIQKVLYDQVRPVLENESVDPNIKKKLACRYVCFMADMRSGMKRRDFLKEQYRNIQTLIGGKE
jgi:hypothetical protein